MVRSFILLSLLLVPAHLGCASGSEGTIGKSPGSRIVCFVTGAGGNVGYTGLARGLREGGASNLYIFSWGAPTPLFVFNFQTPSIHEAAEKKLAERITGWMRINPTCRIELVGHSAGGGVILGALRRLEQSASVEQVVLLSPSVSPTYPLAPVLRHVSRRVDVFYSDRDTLFLKWRTETFGTYDSVRTPAAGHLGFHPESPLPPDLGGKLFQHPYDPKWLSLGNDGGHTGSAAHEFVRTIIAPLLNAPG